MARLQFLRVPATTAANTRRYDLSASSDSPAGISPLLNPSVVYLGVIPPSEVLDDNQPLILGPDGVTVLYQKELDYRGAVLGPALLLTGGGQGAPVSPGGPPPDLSGYETIAHASGTYATLPALAAEAVLRAPVATPAVQEFVAKVLNGVNDVSMVVSGDSTAASSGGWVDTLVPLLAARFPTHSISYRKWDGTSAYLAAVVTAGSGARTINVWNGSKAGETWTYQADSARLYDIYIAPAPDLTIFCVGHNENNTTTDVRLRDRAVATVETVRTWIPGSQIVLMSQNALTAYPAYSARRADIYRRICAERGYGFIDICGAFVRDGRAALASGDGTHPSALGYGVWAAEVMRHFAAAAEAVQPSPLAPPSLLLTRANLLSGGALDTFSAGAVTGWSLINTTLTQDTTNYETGTYSVVGTKTAAGSANYLRATLPRRLVQGREITAAVRLRIPAGAASSVGQIALVDSDGLSISSSNYAYRDQWFWNVVTGRMSPTATTAWLYVYGDPTTGAVLQAINMDRAIVVPGRYPADIA